jgi:type II secretory pathway pseudopilin PulG
MDGNIDAWKGLQNWAIFGVGVGLASFYYYKTQTPRRPAPPAAKKHHHHAAPTEPSEKASTKKSKPPKKQSPTPRPAPSPAPSVQNQEPTRDEGMNDRDFAAQMTKAKNGTNLAAPKSKEKREKTVTQAKATCKAAQDSESSQAGDADDDLSPVTSPTLQAGDVSDMLELTPAGFTTVRVTAAKNPVKEKAPRQKKEETVETKRQRQNKQKKEREQEIRKEQEAQRQQQLENQRRTAREARGEPAKNGVPVSKPPVNNPWAASKPVETKDDSAPLIVTGSSPTLLDTFDVESTASSNPGLEPSTGPTSTSDEPTQRDLAMLSEEEQFNMAKKESEDSSGWTTAAPKKQKKKANANGDINGESIEAKPVQKPEAPASKPAINGSVHNKANGFTALEDQYEDQGVDDPSNWDA